MKITETAFYQLLVEAEMAHMLIRRTDDRRGDTQKLQWVAGYLAARLTAAPTA